eukprot:7389334-Pyramimonas_sp.AAC.1
MMSKLGRTVPTGLNTEPMKGLWGVECCIPAVIGTGGPMRPWAHETRPTHLTHEAVPYFGECHHARGGAPALRVRDDSRLTALEG